MKHISVSKSNITYKSHLYNAMKKYGIEHFRAEIIEECTYEILDKREAYWIKKLNTITPNGYNILPGGKQLHGKDNPFYGKHHTEETKRIISKKNTGRKQSKEEIEVRRKINSGENNPFYGKCHSDETIKRIVSKNTMNGLYQRNSERMKKNNPCNPEVSIKPVIMFDKNSGDIMAFESERVAGEYIKNIGLSKAKNPGNSVGDVCRGKQNSAFGKIWSFINVSLRLNTKESTAGYIINKDRKR